METSVAEVVVTTAVSISIGYILGRMSGMVDTHSKGLNTWAKHVDNWPPIPGASEDEHERHLHMSEGMRAIVTVTGDYVEDSMIPDWLRSKGAL